MLYSPVQYPGHIQPTVDALPQGACLVEAMPLLNLDGSVCVEHDGRRWYILYGEPATCDGKQMYGPSGYPLYVKRMNIDQPEAKVMLFQPGLSTQNSQQIQYVHPTEHTQYVRPAEHTQYVRPAEHTQYVRPAEHTQYVRPAEHTQYVLSTEHALYVRPTEQTQGQCTYQTQEQYRLRNELQCDPRYDLQSGAVDYPQYFSRIAPEAFGGYGKPSLSQTGYLQRSSYQQVSRGFLETQKRAYLELARQLLPIDKAQAEDQARAEEQTQTDTDKPVQDESADDELVENQTSDSPGPPMMIRNSR
ncbi:uncharacterized protein LOC111272504 [Varroa jacobsoni]|uniref:uncharacterized protein LOC111272504 n=1 Tax=Varroa jacobsoni TaxID=62625 RepID=UPI000BF42BD9|nr:uncharacterized protein LOC111272504 [Varroa jacobsoni]